MAKKRLIDKDELLQILNARRKRSLSWCADTPANSPAYTHYKSVHLEREEILKIVEDLCEV